MWHPLLLLRIVFVVLVVALVILGVTTSARPRTAHQWTIVWIVLVLLAWALLGPAWLRSR
jgi:hypothetical protein